MRKLAVNPPTNPRLFFQVCCTRGGKDCIYHLSAFGSAELRDAGQHKIIIHKHEITKLPGDPTTKLFCSFAGGLRGEGDHSRMALFEVEVGCFRQGSDHSQDIH